MKRIGDILTRYKEAETVQDDVTYKQVTIGTNYKGVRLRGTKLGTEIGTKNQWLVKAGQFILSRIDARNSAFGIIPDDLEGALVTNDFMAYDVNEAEVDRDFFNAFLQSPQFLEACIKASRGNTNRKRVQEEFFLSYEVDLPDIDHQRLLIQKIERAKAGMAIAEGESTHQQTLLGKLKQAILQEAIQGKLTADWRTANSDVEPASELLQRIQGEKARLIAEKKIRKEKPLPEITPEEIPFESPDGWEWCRVGSIGSVKVGATPNREIGKFWNGSVPWVSSGEVANNTISKTRETISDTAVDSTSAKINPAGSVLVAMIGQGKTRGQTAILKIDAATNQNVAAIRLQGSVSSEYIWLNFLARYEETRSGASGGNQPALNGIKIRNSLIPLPPLTEQAAIVERVEALMATCRELESEIERSRTHAADLLQAVLKEAFAPAS